ncbi:MAG TPA: metal-dependent hydrolase [Saprospiraceae bacterium]|nr:metal-dependent hydrolase [Saprospiraceae bacterium]
MPSAIGHAIFAISLSPFRPYKNKLLPSLILAMVCSTFPDLDVIGFEAGIPYSSLMGHRGFTHAIFFAILTGILVSYLFFNEQCKTYLDRIQISFFFFIITISHGLLDAMTDGGLGVGFFIPFYNERFFFSYRPIPVSSMHIEAFFTNVGFSILKQELKFIGFISCFVVASGYYWRKYIFDKET